MSIRIAFDEELLFRKNGSNIFYNLEAFNTYRKFKNVATVEIFLLTEETISEESRKFLLEDLQQQGVEFEKIIYIHDLQKGNEKIDYLLTEKNTALPNTIIKIDLVSANAVIQKLSVTVKRIAEVRRNTNETSISIKLNLDGTGISNIKTGLPFFDHMLEQLSKHGNIDLDLQTKGDLQIDEHHTIEDTALALGSAFLEALGDKKGIERYGFLLPMEDVLAQVAIDFGGRPWLIWDADFKREKIGDMPTEMFHHFFKSFCDTAKCNLNIKAEGTNEHHKIEGIFKAFAKAIRMAIQQTNGENIPSTKGIL